MDDSLWQQRRSIQVHAAQALCWWVRRLVHPSPLLPKRRSTQRIPRTADQAPVRRDMEPGGPDPAEAWLGTNTRGDHRSCHGVPTSGTSSAVDDTV